jgi:hypothetical protein
MDPAYKQESFEAPDTNKPKSTKSKTFESKVDSLKKDKEKKAEEKRKKRAEEKKTSQESKKKAHTDKAKELKVESKPKEIPVEVKKETVTVKEKADTLKPVVSQTPPTKGKGGLFENHELQVKHDWPVLRKQQNDDWLIYSLLGVLVLFAVINSVYGKRFKQLTDAFFTSRIAGQLAREENVLQQRLTILLFFTFILITSAFIYLASGYYNFYPFEVTGLKYYYFLIGAILGSYLLKMMIIKFLGFVFKTEKEVSEYVFNIILFNNVLGITLFPFVLCLAFSGLADPAIVIKIAVLLTAILFLFRITRGMIIGVSNAGISKFYLFIYLCTLEILPLVVIFKVLVSRI